MREHRIFRACAALPCRMLGRIPVDPWDGAEQAGVAVLAAAGCCALALQSVLLLGMILSLG